MYAILSPHSPFFGLPIQVVATDSFCDPNELTCLHHIAQIESNWDQIVDSFDSMNLKSELLRGLLDM